MTAEREQEALFGIEDRDIDVGAWTCSSAARTAFIAVAAAMLAACGGGTTDSSTSGSNMLATTAACYAAWNSTTAYNGGALVSYANVNYKANWWTQGSEPGWTAQWRDLGPC